MVNRNMNKHAESTPISFARRILKPFLMVSALFLLAACQQSQSQQKSEDSATQSNKPVALVVEKDVVTQAEKIEELTPVDKAFPFKGTIKYIPLEGGFFGIVTNKGVKFLPLGLPKEYLQDGAEIEFSGTIKKDVMTIQQWGTPFSIKDIKLIKPGNPTKPGLGSQDM